MLDASVVAEGGAGSVEDAAASEEEAGASVVLFVGAEEDEESAAPAVGRSSPPVSHGRITPRNRPASSTSPASSSSGRRAPPPAPLDAAVAPAAAGAKDARCAPRWSVYSGTSSKRSGRYAIGQFSWRGEAGAVDEGVTGLLIARRRVPRVRSRRRTRRGR